MHKTLQDENLGAMLNSNISTFDLFCDKFKWPILGSARVKFVYSELEIREVDLDLIRLQELKKTSLTS